jgi:hypothetical protein
MVKVAFSALGEALGVAARNVVLWEEALKLAKSGNFVVSVRCFAEALTFPWKKRLSPRAHVAHEVWSNRKTDNNIPRDLWILLADLLFVEMWLEVLLNSGNSYSGLSDGGRKTYHRMMVELASDAGALREFVSLIAAMGEGQQTTEQQLHPVLENLASLLRRNAPHAAAIIVKELPAKTRPVHGYRQIDRIVEFLLEGGDINIRDDSGSTLLHLAAAEGKEDLVDTLLAYGANSRIPNNEGKLPLDLAREAGHSSVIAALEHANESEGSFNFSKMEPPQILRTEKELKELGFQCPVLLFTNSTGRSSELEREAVMNLTQKVIPAVRLRLARAHLAPVICWANVSRIAPQQDLDKFLRSQKMGSPGVMWFENGAFHAYKKLSSLSSEQKLRATMELAMQHS